MKLFNAIATFGALSAATAAFAGAPSFTIADIEAARSMTHTMLANVGMREESPNVTLFDGSFGSSPCLVFNPGWNLMTILNHRGEVIFSGDLLVRGNKESAGQAIVQYCLF